MKVKNLNGTSDNKCNCKSWLDHWVKFSNKIPLYCSASGCMNRTDLVGAHVQKADSTDNSWYIIPLCQQHNLKGTSLEIGTSTLISANVNETCAKK